MDLKLPMRAKRRRRSRLRRLRSCSSMATSLGSQGSSAISFQDESRPKKPRRCTRSRRASRSVFGVVIGFVLSEAVVGSERVRTNDKSVEPRVIGELNANGRWLVAISTRLVEQLADGAEVRRVLR